MASAQKPVKIVKIVRSSIEDTATEDNTPEVAEVEEAEIAPAVVAKPAQIQVESVQAKTPNEIRISVFTLISPAPRIGNYSFEHSMGMADLKPGVYNVPHNVGMVLIDKKLAVLA